MSRRIFPARLLLLALLVAGCTMRKSAVWLESASSPEDLTFGVATERGGAEPVAHLNYVAVRTCYSSGEEQTTLWQARGELPSGTAPPTRISYGVPPDGFVSEVPAQPLSPGCYEGIISGNGISGTVRFTVDADRQVTEQQRQQATGQ